MKTLDTVIEAFLAEADLKGQISAYDTALLHWTQCEADSGRLTLRCTPETELEKLRDEAADKLEELRKVLYPEVE